LSSKSEGSAGRFAIRTGERREEIGTRNQNSGIPISGGGLTDAELAGLGALLGDRQVARDRIGADDVGVRIAGLARGHGRQLRLRAVVVRVIRDDAVRSCLDGRIAESLSRRTVGGKPIMVTYCTVCRTGRVFEPIVNGEKEKFRLVGMDHFNAMLEDATTKSWWRQVTGEAIAGKLKGQQLPEVYSTQTSLADWLQLNPGSLIMQADTNFIKSYDSTFKFESGASKSKLTGTDSLSWKDKSWVIGVKAGKESKAYDWNQLKKEKLIQDKIGVTPVLIVLSKNDKSFFAFERPNENSIFNLSGDTLLFDNHKYRIDGKGIDTSFSLKPLPASQEFWHSWRTFNPGTLH